MPILFLTLPLVIEIMFIEGFNPKKFSSSVFRLENWNIIDLLIFNVFHVINSCYILFNHSMNRNKVDYSDYLSLCPIFVFAMESRKMSSTKCGFSKMSYFSQNVSVWHPEKLSPWSQRAEIPGSLPYFIIVNGSHIVIDGKSQNCITTSKEKFSFLMSHTDALYQSEEIDPIWGKDT